MKKFWISIFVILAILLIGGGLFLLFSYREKENARIQVLEQGTSPEVFSQESEEDDIFDDEQQLPLEATQESGSAYMDITPADCANECEMYTGDTEKLSYCKSVCGLSLESGVASSGGDCNEKTGISRDMCIKDEAVKEQSLPRCDDIVDKNIQRSCQNRVAEDFL